MKLSFYLTSLISLALFQYVSSSLLKTFHVLLSNSNCNDDGVCSINQTNNTTELSGQQINIPDVATSSASTSTTATDSPELTANIAELSKLGWGLDESRRALLASNLDIEKAIVSLEEAEEKQKELDLAIKNITDLGWRKEVSFVCIEILLLLNDISFVMIYC